MKTAAAVTAMLYCGVCVALPTPFSGRCWHSPRAPCIFSASSAPAPARWAMTAGAGFGALATLTDASLYAGLAAGSAMMLLCGLATGAIAAALSEMLELLPCLVYRLRLRRDARALCVAFALGKAAAHISHRYKRRILYDRNTLRAAGKRAN